MVEDHEKEPHILSERQGVLTRIKLNRPNALNALTSDMAVLIRQSIAKAHQDGSAVLLLEGAGERGFCGGGDVKSMVLGGREGSRDFLAEEYQTDYAIHRSELPVVGIMDGITMGGGIGLTGHAALRIVTERSRLAMPETRIGIAPDVGGNLLLAAAPGRIGDALAAASKSMDAGDAIALGFADFFIPTCHLPEFIERLSAGEEPRAAALAVAETAPPSSVLKTRAWLDPIADATLGSAQQTLADPVATTSRFLRGLEAAGEAEAHSLATEIRAVCPTAVVISLARLARTRAEKLNLAGVLADDLRVLQRMTIRPDFAEGIRAQLIEKDGRPKWSPAGIDEVNREEVAHILGVEWLPGERQLAL